MAAFDFADAPGARRPMSGRTVRFITILSSAVVLTLSVAAVRRSQTPTTAPFQTPIGNVLADAQLETLDGHTVSLRDRLGGRPALIYVFSAAECASCSNLPLEFKIVHKEAPGLQTLLIGSGSSRDAFAPLIRTMGLEVSALVDEHRAVLHAFDAEREPLVLLVDSSGHVLLADTRTASRAAQFPMGHVLRGLHTVLDAARPEPK